MKYLYSTVQSVCHSVCSLKREMRVMGEDCGLQPVTIAMAFVYFEKLVLQGRLNKQNRYRDIITHPNSCTSRTLINVLHGWFIYPPTASRRTETFSWETLDKTNICFFFNEL